MVVKYSRNVFALPLQSWCTIICFVWLWQSGVSCSIVPVAYVFPCTMSKVNVCWSKLSIGCMCCIGKGRAFAWAVKHSVLTVALHLRANKILSAEVLSIELVYTGSRELAGKVLMGYFLKSGSKSSAVFVCPATLKQGRWGSRTLLSLKQNCLFPLEERPFANTFKQTS